MAEILPLPMAKIQRALISVSDKAGLLPFAQTLAEAGVEIISTGGTARVMREAGLTVIDVSDYTGFPEMMDGRVKTLHPKVHGGLLHLRGNAEHEAAAVEHGVPVPAFSSALAYFDGYRTAQLPANLLQAQRDYFGAHTYKRVDKPRGRFFHIDWPEPDRPQIKG